MSALSSYLVLHKFYSISYSQKAYFPRSGLLNRYHTVSQVETHPRELRYHIKASLLVNIFQYIVNTQKLNESIFSHEKVFSGITIVMLKREQAIYRKLWMNL